MPDLNNLWQRFLLASSLLVGLAVGVASTVFGYSNLTTVDVHWSIFHIDGVPLWTVAVVPIALILITGTLYHWFDGLHHFTEHMRHRRRVHELEAEVARLREHLDHILEMPGAREPELAARSSDKKSLPPADEASADVPMGDLEATDADSHPLRLDSAKVVKVDSLKVKVLDQAPRTATRRERAKRARPKSAQPKLDGAPRPTNGADAKAAATTAPGQGA